MISSALTAAILPCAVPSATEAAEIPTDFDFGAVLSNALKPPQTDARDGQAGEESGKDLPPGDAGGNPLAALPVPPLVCPATTAPAPDANAVGPDEKAQQVAVSLPSMPPAPYANAVSPDEKAQQVAVSLPSMPPAGEPPELTELPAAAVSKDADQPTTAAQRLDPQLSDPAISQAAAMAPVAPAISQAAAIPQGAAATSRGAPAISAGAPAMSQDTAAISPPSDQPSTRGYQEHGSVVPGEEGEALARSLVTSTAEHGADAPQARPSVESGAPVLHPLSRPGTETAISSQDLPRIHLLQPGWEQALAQRVTMMVDQATQRAHLQVHPPQLGPIEVHIDLADDGASVQFSSPHASVRESIEAAAPRLREMLSGSGLQLLSLDVSAHAFSRQQQQDAPQTPAPRVGFAYSGAQPAVRVRVGLLDVYA